MYKYNFDGYIDGKACGWVLDPENPEQPVEVGVYVDGELMVSSLADKFREDLFGAKIGNGNCAFILPVSPIKCDELEVRIIPDGTPLLGSRRGYATVDPFVNIILKANLFESYLQFRAESLKVKDLGARPPQWTKRISQAFSRTVFEQGGVRYSAHMNWMCSRQRRGAPSFFIRNKADPLALDDLYWYLFECKDPSKSFAEIDYEPLNELVFPRFPGLSHHTFLFNLWLHRSGKKLNDIKADGLHAKYDFYVDLISAHSIPPTDTGLKKKSRSNRVQGDEAFIAQLPALTNYLRIKHDRGYRELYQLDNLEGYLCFLFDFCLHAISIDEINLFGEEVLSFWQAPVVVQQGEVSRFALVCYALTTIAANRQQVNLSLLSAPKIVDWFENVWLILHPLHSVFNLQNTAKDSGVNRDAICYIVAFWNNASGLTQNAHMSIKAITDVGITVTQLLPDGTFFGRINPPRDCDTTSLDRDLVMLHVNADDAPAALHGISGWVDLDRALVVGYFLWELEEIPEAHLLGVDLVDEIWVPTDFVADAYRKVAAHKVYKVGKGITIPDIDTVDRKKFNLPDDSKIFLVSFDFHSSVERKNPLAAVKAFLIAFEGRNDVCLVLKSTTYQPEHWGDPFDQWGNIIELVQTDERIFLIDEYLPDREMFELIVASDVIVSPHRAEGFGYLPAYGLLYGKQVVVTGYSGPNDYCNEKNSLIAQYDLVKVPNGRFIYQVPDAVW